MNLSTRKQLIDCKWDYKIKYRSIGFVERYKDLLLRLYSFENTKYV